MSNQWMFQIELPLTAEQFQRLPRNGAYRYEYLAGKAYLSPWPRYYRALLDLPPPVEYLAEPNLTIWPMEINQMDKLASLFSDAFSTVPPFGGLPDEERLDAARQALRHTQSGGDGPWIRQASFIAGCSGELFGAILVTLLPPESLLGFAHSRWQQVPPLDCIQRRLGIPHLTWIFVSPWHAGRGIGTALLQTACQELVKMGFRQLLSTFMSGNESSMLWHWRNGFRILSDSASDRSRAGSQR
ncbi:MAG: hypothetical protein KatS3mg105_1918 [Gemmatales bacterium]|nr:MAG: hypothetical protein KatS3mg105_1918 [Gemmatales bacterium]